MRNRYFLLAALLASAAPVLAEDRASTMHSTYCVMCHDAQIYTRKDRVAKNYEEIRAQVDRWQQVASLKWSPADIDLMTAFLASKFYQVRCPMDC